MSDLVFNVHLAEGMRFADSRTGDTYQVVSISKVNMAEREGLIKTSTGDHLSEEELTTGTDRKPGEHQHHIWQRLRSLLAAKKHRTRLCRTARSFDARIGLRGAKEQCAAEHPNEAGSKDRVNRASVVGKNAWEICFQPIRRSVDFVCRKRYGSTVNDSENFRTMLGDNEMHD